MKRYYQISEGGGFFRRHLATIVCSKYYDEEDRWDDNPRKDGATLKALEKLSIPFTTDAECMYSFDESPESVRLALNGLGWAEKDIGASE